MLAVATNESSAAYVNRCSTNANFTTACFAFLSIEKDQIHDSNEIGFMKHVEHNKR